MLVDVKLANLHDREVAVLRAIGGDDPRPKPLAHVGCYLITHFNFDMYIRGILVESYPDLPLAMHAYGVCDSPGQLIQDFGEALADSARRFVVSFTRIQRADQPPSGGWRWHKWGPYVGHQQPTCEYLYDEANIEEVYTYHVYEVREAQP